MPVAQLALPDNWLECKGMCFIQHTSLALCISLSLQTDSLQHAWCTQRPDRSMEYMTGVLRAPGTAARIYDFSRNRSCSLCKDATILSMPLRYRWHARLVRLVHSACVFAPISLSSSLFPFISLNLSLPVLFFVSMCLSVYACLSLTVYTSLHTHNHTLTHTPYYLYLLLWWKQRN